MAFASVLDGAVVIGDNKPRSSCSTRPRPHSVSAPKVSKKSIPVVHGCDECPLNKEGVRKLNRYRSISGKSVFLWSIAPGIVENSERSEFTGPVGRFLWTELKRVGISRADCDMQYIVRCWPAMWVNDRLVDRAPTKDEIKHCSQYNAGAVAANQGKAAVYLVFGQTAASVLLGREYRKDRPTFWSEKFQAKVYVLEHPQYFIKGGGHTSRRLHEWRSRLAEAAQSAKRRGQYSFLESQDYRYVKSVKVAKAIVRKVRAAAKAGGYTSFDIEYGYVNQKTGKACDRDEPNAKQVILVVGVSWRKGVSRIFLLDHPDNPLAASKRDAILVHLREILEDKTIRKCAHHGTADVTPLKELLGVTVRGYRFDTNYSTYLAWPQLKRYGLDEMSNSRVPEFAGYKAIVLPHLADPPNYATIPLPVMRLYNGADCDITLRLQRLTSKWDGPLLRTYRDVAFVLDKMQHRGPYFDQRYYDTVVSRIPRRLQVVKKQLMRIAGDSDFNPNAPAQVSKVIYDKLGFEPVENFGERSTSADVLRIMAQDKKRGKFPALQIEFRELSKMEGTYLSNYRNSAELNGGQLRTIWWLTGTITGRLRSGGKDRGQQGIVNFQNLHGDPMLQNLLVSDTRWRAALKYSRAVSNGESSDLLQQLWKRVLARTLFLNFDYGQVEIRIAAELSGDPLLLAAVESGDIHSAVGHELTGWSVDKIRNDKQTRTLVKNLHFGILYGMSAKSLFQFLQGLGVPITQERADELLSTYFRKYRKVREMIEHLREQAERLGYVETLFGFKRPITTEPDEDGRASFWGNQAINSPIQGTAHQLLLFAMALLHQHPERYPHLAVPVMEVHDALSFYTQVQSLAAATEEGIHLLQTGVPEYILRNFKYKLRVPLVAEAKAGFRLGVLTDYTPEQKLRSFVQSWVKKSYEVESKIEEKWGKAA